MPRMTTCRRTMATILVGVLGIIAYPGLDVHHAVHAASLVKAPTACHAVRVQLNGDQPAVTTCLDPQPGQVQPDIAQGGCDPNHDVFLYRDANYGGDYYCFHGSGYADMTTYNFNDSASSFKYGTNSGRFYWNTGGGYPYWQYTSGSAGGNFNPTWNDQVSSICTARSSTPTDGCN